MGKGWGREGRWGRGVGRGMGGVRMGKEGGREGNGKVEGASGCPQVTHQAANISGNTATVLTSSILRLHENKQGDDIPDMYGEPQRDKVTLPRVW